MVQVISERLNPESIMVLSPTSVAEHSSQT